MKASRLWQYGLFALCVAAIPASALATDGANGPDVDAKGGVIGTQGLPGSTSTDSTPGGNGGDGGSVKVVTDGSVPGEIDVGSQGAPGGDSVAGAGGDGGNGGNVSVTAATPVAGDIIIGSQGSVGGGSIAGSSGSGGDGGDVKVVINAPVSGGVVIGSQAGPGGSSGDGTGGDGGTGGTVNVIVRSTVSKGIVLASQGGQAGLSSDGTAGSEGAVNVRLGSGAVVGGTIEVSGNVANLDFAMHVKDRAELRAAAAYLADPSNAGNGSITINGHTYTWVGFDTLDNDLTLLSRTAAGGSAGGDAYLSCLPRGRVVAYRTGPDSVTFNAKNPDGGGFFRVGALSGATFVSANPLGWSVALQGTGMRKAAQVLDGAGAVVATCRL